MDKVTILSRLKFLEYLPPVPKEQVVAIRIGDVAPVKDLVTNSYLDTIAFGFFDNPTPVEEIDRTKGAGSNSFTEKDKVVLDEFIDKYADKYFVVHCDAGMSRSAAIGYYILKRLGHIVELNEKKTGDLYYFSPNIEVYGLLIGKPYTRKNGSELRKEVDTPE